VAPTTFLPPEDLVDVDDEAWEIENPLAVEEVIERREALWRRAPVTVESVFLPVSEDAGPDTAGATDSTKLSVARSRGRRGSSSRGVLERVKFVSSQDEEASGGQDQAWVDAALDELKTASRLRHPNILEHFGVMQLPGELAILCECRFPTLAEFIEDLDDEDVKYVSKDLANGLQFIHARGVAHQHLCPDNIFIREAEGMITAKLGGIIAARTVCRVAHKPFVPSSYTPKSTSLSEVHSKAEAQDPRKSDIYGFGVLVCYLHTREEPDADTRVSQVNRIGKKAVEMVVMKCLESDPSQRPSATMLQAALKAIEEGREPSFEPTALDITMADGLDLSRRLSPAPSDSQSRRMSLQKGAAGSGTRYSQQLPSPPDSIASVGAGSARGHRASALYSSQSSARSARG